MSSGEPILTIDFGTSMSAAYLVVPGAEPAAVYEPPDDKTPLWPSSVLATKAGLLIGSQADQQKLNVAPGTFRTEFKLFLASTDPFSLGIGDYRRDYLPVDLVRELIRRMATAAASKLRSLGGPGMKLGRTVLTIPASYAEHRQPRALMIAAAEDVGLGPVELLYEPVAAAWGVRKQLAANGGQLVLVYDYGGGTFDAALVDVRSARDWRSQVQGIASVQEGGKDIDADLVRLLRDKSALYLASRLGELASGTQAAPQDVVAERQDVVAERRHRFEVESRAAAERMKIHLSTATPARDQIFPDAPVVEVSRQELEGITRPRIARTVACCRRLLAAKGKTARDLDAILLVGGGSRIPLVAEMLAEEFGKDLPRGDRVPLEAGMNRDFAVAHGAAIWAIENEIPLLPAAQSRAEDSMLRWNLDIPGDADLASPALMRWHVDTEPERHQEYEAGQPLARIRYANGTVWDLAASEPGRFGRALAEPHETPDAQENGLPIRSRDWIASTERW